MPSPTGDCQVAPGLRNGPAIGGFARVGRCSPGSTRSPMADGEPEQLPRRDDLFSELAAMFLILLPARYTLSSGT